MNIIEFFITMDLDAYCEGLLNFLIAAILTIGVTVFCLIAVFAIAKFARDAWENWD